MSNARNLARLLPNASGQLPPANVQKLLNTNMAAGSVLQVVQAVKYDSQTISSQPGVFSDVYGLAAYITPSSATSKILVIYTINGSSDNNAGMHTKLQRGGVDIYIGDAASGESRVSTPGFFAQGGANEGHMHTAVFLDTPASTSSLYYKIVGSGGGATAYLNRAVNVGNAFNGRTPSSLTLMEIAA